jgi:hypothetical protein
MKVPNSSSAVVARAKVERYLLSATHPWGRHKAAFFLRFGFKQAKWAVLQASLLRHVAQHEVASVEQRPLGVSYTVVGELETPDGRLPLVRTVWFIDEGQEVPRFATAYPLQRRL